jgi:ABC-type dipeptide/oligopeptide/nickel transport system ATPase component
LEVIPGVVPNLVDLPPGCRFASRCKARVEHSLSICTETKPGLLPVADQHNVRCWLYHGPQAVFKDEPESHAPTSEPPDG